MRRGGPSSGNNSGIACNPPHAMSKRITIVHGGRRFGRKAAISMLSELREDAAYWKDQSTACLHDMMESGKYLNQSRRCKEQADQLEQTIQSKL